MVLAGISYLAGWITGIQSFVLICVGFALILYRKRNPETEEERSPDRAEPEPRIVAQNPNYALIQLWAEKLHDEGIPTEIRDEFMGSILSQPGRNYSEIKLLVPARFEKRARDILQN
tara:strand:- start:7206 stop:7556 length:351 start_codon:yes stop_codon:yes gene_type:complete